MKHGFRVFPLCLSLCLWGMPAQIWCQSYETNGAAQFLSGNCYQLTPDQGGLAGSVFSSAPIDLTQPFTLSCVFFFGCKDANGADGIVFILGTNNTALGIGGGGIGYQGIAPSIAIEYDDYQNGWGDPAQDHMAIVSNGIVDHNAPENLVGPVVIAEMEDCMDHCFTVSWDPVSQTLTGDLDGQIISYTGDLVNTIFGGNPIVFYGFSAGTGSLSNQHLVCIGPPVLDPMDDVTICEGEQAQLDADANGNAWSWAPDPTLSATHIRNPVATPVQTTLYAVTIDYACGGTATDDVLVTVIPSPVVTASGNSPLCPGEDLLLMGDGGVNYQWSGPGGFFSNMQNPVVPDVTQAQSGIYTVTATDASGCSSTASVQVLVFPAVEPMIDPAGVPICENGEVVQLSASPPGGTWSGDVGANGIFDPVTAGAGIHLITYTVTDANGCTGTDQMIIEVVPNTPALIIPEGPFCLNDPVQVLSATPAGGIWGEAGEPNGVIDPAALGVGVHVVTYTYSDQNGCFDAEIFIEILAVPDVSIIPVEPLCPDDTIQFLSGTPPGGIWSGDTGPDGMIVPYTLGPGMFTGIYTLEAPNGCQNADTVDILVLPFPPEVTNFSVDCDSFGTGFIVSFEISGGDPASYSVTGNPGGTLIPGSPYVFVSDTIAQGDSYQFLISDQYNCDPTAIAGSFSCSCATDAGMMSNVPIVVCLYDTVVVPPVTGSIPDQDDAVIYVLHHGSGNFLDDVIAVNDQGVFYFQPPMQPGVTYYVSAVAGNAVLPGGVDFNDPCLSVTPGTPVRWLHQPSGYLFGTDAICVSDSFLLNFILSGEGPFSVTFTDGTDTMLLDSISNGHVLPFLLNVSTTFTLLTVDDLSEGGCIAETDTLFTVNILQEYFFSEERHLCEGDSIFLGGAFRNKPGIYTDSLTSVAGCDSIIETALFVYSLSLTELSETSCDSSMTGVFEYLYADRHGCDSMVIVTVMYALSDTTRLQSTSCDPQDAGTFTSLYLSSDGCDSVVIETVTFSPPDTTMIFGGTCDPAEAGEWIQNLNNQSGCDSIVIEVVTLNPSWMIEVYDETCDPAEAGTVVHTFQTAFGCDSVIIETIVFIESDTVELFQMTCEPADTGTSVSVLTNAAGCDSLVIVVTSPAPEEECNPVLPERNIYVPNIFSPNADHINDGFTLYGDQDFVRISYLRIYDRWGGVVFSRSDFLPGDPALGWDGSVRGKILDPGVFVWIAEVIFQDGFREILSGDVALMR